MTLRDCILVGGAVVTMVCVQVALLVAVLTSHLPNRIATVPDRNLTLDQLCKRMNHGP